MPRARPEILNVRIGGELLTQIQRYHRESGLPGTAQDAVRELLLVALQQPDLEGALLRSARVRAYKQTRTDFYDLMQLSLADMQRTWERQAAEPITERLLNGDEQQTG